MSRKKTTVYIEEDLLRAAKALAARTGKKEHEVFEEALVLHLAAAGDPARTGLAGSGRAKGESFGEIFARVRESQRRRGIEPLSDEEAMRLAVEEQHAHRRGE